MDREHPTERSIWLWPGRAPGSEIHDGSAPWLDPYPIETTTPRGAVLVCPGGGYAGRARHEGVLVARRFNEAGLHAFVVHYRVAPHRHPAPLMDASRAIRMIRHRAAEWQVHADRIAVCGFSAGGHLAASLGVHFDSADIEEESPYDELSCRPDALILCYPVISSGKFANRGSFFSHFSARPDRDPLRPGRR